MEHFTNAELDLLWNNHLLCEVCAQQRWTVHARWHDALICSDCAATEPEPTEDT